MNLRTNEKRVSPNAVYYRRYLYKLFGHCGCCNEPSVACSIAHNTPRIKLCRAHAYAANPVYLVNNGDTR